jgi:hypothetical protein
MLQERQIVNDLGNQINIENPIFMKYTIISFHSIVWILISVIVTINRNVLRQRLGIVTTKLRSST